MPDTRTAVATRREQQDEKQKAFARYIERLGPQIARALPAHLTGDRMTRLALTAVRQTPALAECSEVSMAGALLTAAALGLEPNTPTGEAYLVPYSGEVQFQMGYQGMVKLFWQHPLAAQIEAEAVFEADDFDYAMGSGAFLRYKPNKRAADRGQLIFFFAFAKLTTGAEAFVVLTPEECKDLRQGKVGPDPRFKGGDPQHWMERKTAVRQLFKLLPKTPNMARAAQADEQGGTDLFRAAAAERVPAQRAIAGEVLQPDEDVPAGVDVVTGEVIEDGPAPGEVTAAVTVPAKATQRQMNNIHRLLAGRGITSDEAVHSALADILSIEVTSRSQLTKDQAGEVIEHLEKLPPAGEQA